MKEDALAKLARKQFGVFSREQALQFGSRSAVGRRLAHREWERVHSQVYRVRGCPPTGKQPLMAAWLAAGPSAAISHVSAARLWQLDGLDHQARQVELSVPLALHPRLTNVVIHRVKSLDGCSMILEGFRITTLTRTMVDLAGRLSRNDLEKALDSATRRSPEVLLDILDCIKDLGTVGRPGLRVLRELANWKMGRSPTDSDLEGDALQRLRHGGFPTPQTQWPVFDLAEDVPFIHLDFAYPQFMIAIVCNGLRSHGNRRRFDLDATQLTRLTGLGWRVVSVTTGTVKADAWLNAVTRLLPNGAVRGPLGQCELW